MLYGRDAEQAALERLLAETSRSRGGVLVVRGSAGIGKTALLDEVDRLATSSSEHTVPRSFGVEAEAALEFAGLHMLLRPHLDRISTLPEPQAAALRSAFGLAGGGAESDPSDRFLTGLATLSMLESLADEQPVVCLIDDAQWLDRSSADALLFAARRVGHSGIAFVFAVGEGGEFDSAGLPEITVRPLAREPAAAMLPVELPPHVRERILDEAQGNPLALRELAAAGDSPGVPSPGGVQQAFAARLAALPAAAQTLLLVAAADDAGDLSVVLQAAETLGAGIADLEAAEERRLVSSAGGRLVFGHPLARAAAYQNATLYRRLSAHRALADVLAASPEDADRRARHLAAATTKPDESVAAELEGSAEQARARGGDAAVAGAYEEAARLSVDRRNSARRLVAAARAAARAGQPARAAGLADQSTAQLADPESAAQLVTIRAGRAYDEGRPERAHRMRLEAAASIADKDPDEAAFLLFKAMTDAWNVGDPALIQETASRARALRAGPDAATLVAGVEGLAQIAIDEPQKGIPLVRALLESARDYGNSLTVAERTTAQMWNLLAGDIQAAYDHSASIERELRAAGAKGVLPGALEHLAQVEILLGLHREARTHLVEGATLAGSLDQRHAVSELAGALAYLSAIEGRTDVPYDGIDTWSMCAAALYDLGTGRHETALWRLEQLDAGPARNHTVVFYCLPDQVEAAVRLGAVDRAERPLARFEKWASALDGQPWAEAILLRLRALLVGPAAAAEQLYEDAVRLHRHALRPFERGRTELLYGEWLRRHRRRTDARVQLRSALDIFVRLDAQPWVERTRAELRAAGEGVDLAGEGTDLLSRLTSQELQVVRLAAQGLSNRDIAAQMFISPRTVGYHLYKAYPKLGIASRAELARLQLPRE